MSNPSKDKGTRCETAVVRLARENGWPDAERLALAGASDCGDVRLSRDVIVQVKAGKYAQAASLAQIDEWMAATRDQRDRAGARLGVLVVQRRGLGLTRVGLWDAHLPLGRLFDPTSGEPVGTLRLIAALHVLRDRLWAP